MDKITLAFIVLIVVLFLAQFAIEGFVDASGSTVDASGGYITLSLVDLLSLFRSTSTSTSSDTSTSSSSSSTETATEETESSPLDQQFITDLRNSIVSDVRDSMREQLQQQGSKNPVLTDSCIDSVANQQGSDWMRYIPGKNPADYIRKDSIPCYGCSL